GRVAADGAVRAGGGARRARAGAAARSHPALRSGPVPLLERAELGGDPRADRAGPLPARARGAAVADGGDRRGGAAWVAGVGAGGGGRGAAGPGRGPRARRRLRRGAVRVALRSPDISAGRGPSLALLHAADVRRGGGVRGRSVAGSGAGARAARRRTA